MHDLHLADQILAFVQSEAKKRRLKKVTQIKIELGQISEHAETIKPENLKFNLENLNKGTIFENGKAVVLPIKEEGIYRVKEISGE